MRQILTINGKPLSDFGTYYDGAEWWQIPERDIETITVAGRSGDLIIDNNRFNNISIPFNCFIKTNFRGNYTALINYLMSLRGYQRVESNEQPDIYRMGIVHASIQPEMLAQNRKGTFEIEIDFKPQKWLKQGESVIDIETSTSLYNPSQMASKPLIMVTGTGTITINGEPMELTANTGKTFIDAETQDCYEGTINRNGDLILSGEDIPSLTAGLNTITYTGFTAVQIIPRWWQL